MTQRRARGTGVLVGLAVAGAAGILARPLVRRGALARSIVLDYLARAFPPRSTAQPGGWRNPFAP
jgi:hypothetical protein